MTVMRKNAVFIFSLLGLALPSCANPIYRDYVYSPLNNDPFVEIQKDGFYRIGDYDSYESNGHEINMDFSSIYQLGNVRFNMPTVGEVPLLVIPIDFEDSVGNISSIKNIESAFKGDNGTNQYVSVAEYYDRCSLGRLHLLPHVTDRFFRSSTYPKKSDLASLTGSGAVSTLTRLYNEALAWFGETYPSISLDDYSFLAKNGSKKIPLYFIYNAPYSGEADGSSNRDSMFWAFTINSPSPISWSSIDMMHLSSNKVDAHTYIHETGHLLGLEDYYDTFSTSILSKVSPLGRMDMMDCSLGDQNAFSKMLLGWERPFVPTSDCEITIHQSSLNNECILLSPSWNKTLFDQYVLLEFYTPTGLNKVDALYRNDPSMRLMRRPGVKAYLIRGNLKLYNGNVQTGEYLTPMGCEMQTWKVGRAFAAKKLREIDGIWGGELAGHYYFRDFFYSDSGLLASIILLNIVAGLKREGSSLSEAIGQIVRYRNSGEINYRVEDKSGAMDAVKEHFMSQEQATAFMDFDGYRVEFQDWWFNIRPSNTEPYLRFICEATSEALLQEKIAQTDAILAERFGGKR